MAEDLRLSEVLPFAHSSPRTVLFFPGQGVQWRGMFGADPVARSAHEELVLRLATEIFGWDPVERARMATCDAELQRTDVCQCLVFVASVLAALRLGRERPELFERCGAVLGLSLGELTAMTVAGALTIRSALVLVKHRALAMHRAATTAPANITTMLSLVGVVGGRQAVTAVVDRLNSAHAAPQCWVCNDLAHDIVVVGGIADFLVAVQWHELLDLRKCEPLAVAAAFHTPLMAHAADDLAALLAAETVRIDPPVVPIVSNVSARMESDPQRLTDNLAVHIVSPVRWTESLDVLLDDEDRIAPHSRECECGANRDRDVDSVSDRDRDDECDKRAGDGADGCGDCVGEWIEVGPGRVCTILARRALHRHYGIDNDDDTTTPERSASAATCRLRIAHPYQLAIHPDH